MAENMATVQSKVTAYWLVNKRVAGWRKRFARWRQRDYTTFEWSVQNDEKAVVKVRKSTMD